MPLTLITGRAIAGKTGELHRALIEAAVRKRQCVLMLPSFADVQRARADLAQRAPVGILVTTLDRWAQDLWSKWGDGRRFVTPTTRRALVAATLCEIAANPMETTRGYRELLEVVAARASGVRQERAVGATDADRRILEVLEAYEARCTVGGLIEPAAALAMLASEPPVTGAAIAANRFTDLSSAQTTFLSGLAACNDVLVSVTWEEGHPACEASRDAIEQLSAGSAFHRHMSVPDPVSELGFLEAEIFDPSNRIEAGGAVVLAEAAGEEAEAAIAARAVRSFLEEGRPPETVAVAFRDLARRRHLVAAALSAEGLQFEMDVALPFEATPLGAALLSLVDAIRGIGGLERLGAFLHSPYSGVGVKEAEAFDERVRKRRLDRHALISEASKIASARPVLTAAKAAVGSDTGTLVENWEILVEAMVAAALSAAVLTDDDRRLDSSVARAVGSAAAELAALEGTGPASMDLLEVLRGQKIAPGASERKGRVYVTEAARLRARRFACVVLGGLTAEEFSSEMRESLAARVLSRLGLPQGGDERLSERLLFYSVVTRAAERLVLVRQSSDAHGAALRPSVFWDEVLDLYRSPASAAEGGEEGIAAALTLPMSRLSDAAPAYSSGRRAVRRSIESGEIVAAEPRRGDLSTPLDEGAGREYSVTELETYHACPYRWFYERIFRPRELDAKFDGRERGACVHELLSEFHRVFRQTVGTRVTPANIDAAMEALRAAVATVESRQRVQARGLKERLDWTATMRWAEEAVVQDAGLFEGFEPAYSEWHFGERADRAFSLGGIRLRGAADRIDVGASGLIVTDYKSSSSVVDHSRFVSAGLLQAVVYAEAAAATLGIPIVASAYRSLPTGTIRGFWRQDRAEVDPSLCTDALGEEAHDGLREWAAQAIRAAADGIRSTDIAPRPRSKDTCTWCSAAPFCGARQ